jgi:hypothetical protein
MGFKLTTSVMIGTDCTGSCKSNYHTITTMAINKEKRQDNNIIQDKTNISLSLLKVIIIDNNKVTIREPKNPKSA